MTRAMKARLHDLVLQEPFNTLRVLKGKLLDEFQIDVSISTIARDLELQLVRSTSKIAGKDADVPTERSRP